MTNFFSRRSPVVSGSGICCSSQPLATAAGIRILNSGGKAADACVAMAAVLNVVEPCSTGIGGDAFALYYDAITENVCQRMSCLQGNGASPASLTLDYVNSLNIGIAPGQQPLDSKSGLCVTVPGAAALWEDLINKFGTMSMSDILAPAIKLAEEGFALSTITAELWRQGKLQGAEAFRVFRPNGESPAAGQLITNVDLARTFREIAVNGAKQGFYTNRIASAIVEAVKEIGGVMSIEDLASHKTAFEAPISVQYRDVVVYEPPPPTHGVAALMALKLYEKATSLHAIGDNDCDIDINMRIHLEIECMRIAFADTLTFIGDPLLTHNNHTVSTTTNATASSSATTTTTPSTVDASLQILLSDEYITQRAKDIQPHTVTPILPGGRTPLAQPPSSGTTSSSYIENSSSTSILMETERAFKAGETVYFCAVDRYGNGCSMINSNYLGFGSGKVPLGCGFSLQNRGHNFSLMPNHANVLGPKKRPYHTIIPGMMTSANDGRLVGAFGVMGGFMQPQGHFQVLRNLLDFKMNPQVALEAPRWYVSGLGQYSYPDCLATSHIVVEEGFELFWRGARQSSIGVSWDGSGEVGKQLQEMERKTETIEENKNRVVNSGRVQQDVSIRDSLSKKGHSVEIVEDPLGLIFGRGQIIVCDRRHNGVYWGGSDPRADGCAMPGV